MVEVDVWVRGRQDAATERIAAVDADAASWTDIEVKRLLEGMLLAIERVKNPGGVAPEVSLRGFSWIVSPDQGGVLLHLEMQLGTVSAGPPSGEGTGAGASTFSGTIGGALESAAVASATPLAVTTFWCAVIATWFFAATLAARASIVA